MEKVIIEVPSVVKNRISYNNIISTIRIWTGIYCSLSVFGGLLAIILSFHKVPVGGSNYLTRTIVDTSLLSIGITTLLLSFVLTGIGMGVARLLEVQFIDFKNRYEIVSKKNDER